MVADWWLSLSAWFIGLFPEATPEMHNASWQFTGALDQIIGQVARLAPVVPFEGIAVGAGVLFAFTGFALVLQVSRIVVSFVTLGGGST